MPQQKIKFQLKQVQKEFTVQYFKRITDKKPTSIIYFTDEIEMRKHIQNHPNTKNLFAIIIK